nr:EOG090X0MTI [Cyclestheria hislopi]
MNDFNHEGSASVNQFKQIQTEGMAGAGGRYVKSKDLNPFFDDDDLEDVDDETFLRKAPAKSLSGFNIGGSSGYKYSNLSSEKSQSFSPVEEPDTAGNAIGSGKLEDRRQLLLIEKQRIEQRTIESSNRAVGILYETEQVGVSTAEELIRQREQLERTNTRLDEMNNSLRSSEKHIQNIKSVFSSIKNYFSKPTDAAKTNIITSPAQTSSRSSELGKMLEDSSPSRQSSVHPGLRTRGLNDDFDHKPLSDVDTQLDENLGIMSHSLSRLKGLAQGLSVELDDQNKLLDRLQNSADKADWRIQRQNKDMERLLKK